MKKYTVFCKTDNKFEDVISENKPTQCPTDSNHLIDSNRVYELKTDSLYDDDYLKRKVDNKSTFDATSGADEQAKFNNLVSDSERLKAVEFNNISDSIAVPFLMGFYSLDFANASNLYGGLVLKSIEQNAEACKQRFNNKANGWFPILFAFFTTDTAQSIIDAVRDYMSDYVNYAKFGIDYGDAERGLFDFIDNTNGVITSLEDYALKSGSDYTSVKAALKTYFRG